MDFNQLRHLGKSYNGTIYNGAVVRFQPNDGKRYVFKSRWERKEEADDFLTDNRLEFANIYIGIEEKAHTVWFNLIFYDCPKCGVRDYAKKNYHHCVNTI